MIGLIGVYIHKMYIVISCWVKKSMKKSIYFLGIQTHFFKSKTHFLKKKYIHIYIYLAHEYYSTS